MSWTEDRVTVLKKLWTDGLSAAQIAKQLGGVTRNAVIGKVHRLGLAGRATPSRPVKRPVRPAKAPAITQVRPVAAAQPARPSVATPASSSVSTNLPALAAPVAAALPPQPLEDGRVATVLTLNDRICKWPIGDPTDEQFAFCGRAAGHAQGPYCPEHARVAYQPQQPRKKVAGDRKTEMARYMRIASA